MSLEGSQNDLTAEHEQVDGDSRATRINVRRSRVAALRTAKKEPLSSDDNGARRQKKGTESQEIGESRRQINLSRKHLDAVKNTGVDDVTSIRVSAVDRETLRRVDEQKKTSLLRRKHVESDQVVEGIAKQIEETWAKALAMKGPYELYEMLEQQKEACQQLITVRDLLLVEYQAELKRKDDDYVKELKRQTDEIDQLLDRMDAQHREYKHTLREEFEKMEQAFVEERNELILKNTKEIDEMFEKRRRNERKALDDKALTVEEHIKLAEEIRVRDAEEYNLQKIRLEKDVQVLEQQLQQMRATYQLNTEKLEYNSSVLKKRDEENNITINQQKRKITRLTDVVNLLRTKLDKQEKSYMQDYTSLNDDYRRISMQFRELQKKFKHFQLNDEKKYQEVWEMNEEMVKEQLHKILMADRIIYERELRLPWTPPDNIESVNTLVSAKSEARTTHSSGPTKLSSTGRLPVSDVTVRLIGSNNALVKCMLELLINEASFLVEDKLLRLLKPLPKGEQFLMKLDTIFKSLGVESDDDIEKLLARFILPQHHGSIQDISAELSGAIPTLSKDIQTPQKTIVIQDPEAMVVHPNEVVRVIRYFLKEKGLRANGRRDTPNYQSQHDKYKNNEETESFNQNKIDSDGSGGYEEDGVRSSTGNDVQRKAVQNFWTQLSNTLDSKKFGLWNSILAAMDSYHMLLTTRHKLSVDVQGLEQQNGELKRLLREYMSAKVNEELEVPPSRVIMSHLQSR